MNKRNPLFPALMLGILLCGTVAPPTKADSIRRFFYGDEAAMTGGAGMAVVQDAGALWYNPAGLGGNSYRKLHIAATAYGFQARQLDSLLKTRLSDGMHTQSAAPHQFGIVPSTLSLGLWRNDRVSVGFGVFQTQNEAYHLRANQRLIVPETGNAWNFGMEYHQQSIRYHVGPGIGIRLHNKLKWGLACFVAYQSLDASIRAFQGIQQSSDLESDYYSLQSQFVTVQRATVTATTGFQYAVAPGWHVGLVVRAPEIATWRKESTSTLGANSRSQDGLLPANFDYDDSRKSTTAWRLVAPAEFQMGVVYGRGENWVGAEAALKLPLADENQKMVWNSSLGGHVALSGKTAVGLGVFTDNDSQKHASGTLTRPLQRFGLTAGVQLRSAELVEPITGDAVPARHHLRKRVLMTTLAFTYALQMVEYYSFLFEVNNDTATMDFAMDKATFHDFSVHLGGGFYF